MYKIYIRVCCTYNIQNRILTRRFWKESHKKQWSVNNIGIERVGANRMTRTDAGCGQGWCRMLEERDRLGVGRFKDPEVCRVWVLFK